MQPKFIRKNILNIVEPTLINLAGHEYAYVASLVNANQHFGFDLKIWLGRSNESTDLIGKLLYLNKNFLKIYRFFFRPVRQLQKIFLYYYFFSKRQPFYVCTSGLFDLLVCYYLHKLFKFTNFGQTAFFYFHQFNKSSNKLNSLAKISPLAKKQFKIFTTTPKLTRVFQNLGFTSAATLACPSIRPASYQDLIKEKCHFTRILYAGLARQDKGFNLVVDTIAFMQTNHANLSFRLQVTAPNARKLDPQTAHALIKLQNISYVNPNIKLLKGALTTAKYQELFLGAICLLLYDPKLYADKFSGVTLDAIYAGCPVITVSNTWMGEITAKFNAGIVLSAPTPSLVSNAILQVIDQYQFYHNNAKKAAVQLAEIHDPKHSLQAVYDYL